MAASTRVIPLFSSDQSTLQIFLYYDELELCNPLGSKRKKHKLGAFYYVLGNLHPKFRQRLSSIQLLCLVKSTIVKEFGMMLILENILKDFKILEKGVMFEGISHPIKGCIAVCSADNLGSQELGGYKIGGSSFRVCRHCLATDSDIQCKFVESSFTLRTPESHAQHCNLIESIPELSKHYSTVYGINCRSTLDSQMGFSVAEGALIPDIMHDVLEGALPLELKHMLMILVNDLNLFNLGMVNNRFRLINLQYMDENIPTPLESLCLTADGSLKQNASQMWTLGRFLPLIVGDLIPDDNEHWKNFLTLLMIMDILFSPTIPVSECGYLESLISDHHINFRHLYPNLRITPKLHYMTHMPRLIVQYGPLVNHWTMRFEAKHCYFKQLAHVLGNFTNISYSLGLRHQLLQCYQNLNTESLPGEEMEIGPG